MAVHQHGQRVRLRCESEREARALAQHVARLELAGQNVIEAIRQARIISTSATMLPTLRTALPLWIAQQVALGEIRHSTARAYRVRCARGLYKHNLGEGRCLGDLPVGQIRREHLGAVILRIREAGRSRAIVNAVVAPVRRYFAELVDAGLLPVNPAVDLARYLGKLRKPARTMPGHFAPEEILQLLATAQVSIPRWYPFVLTGLLAGLRFGELAALRPDDVDLARGILRVERTVSDRDRIEPVKDGEPRLVRLSPTLRATLAAHLERLEPGTTVLFPTKAGGRLDHRYFAGRVWGRLLQKAGLPYRKPHSLRHSYAVAMLESGADLRLVRDQMGHSTVAITADLYGAHVGPDRQARAVEGLDRVLGLAPGRHPAPPGSATGPTSRLFSGGEGTYTSFTPSAGGFLARTGARLGGHSPGRGERRRGCFTTEPRTAGAGPVPHDPPQTR